MIKKGFTFEFEIPNCWSETNDNDRYIYHGPNGEELIISGTIIKGKGTKCEFISIRERLFENAVRSVNNAASHPDLVVKTPLNKERDAFGIQFWTLHAESTDGEIVFLESILISDSAILLITFEAPNTSDSKSFYENFLSSIDTC